MSNTKLYLALKYMLISTLAFTFLNVTVKYLSHLSVYQLIFFRASGTLIFTLGLLRYKGISIMGNKRGLLFLRALVGLTSMGLFFYALKILSVGTAVSLRYTSPIFAAVFAIFLLKERVMPKQWLCFFIAFIGVILLKGFDLTFSTKGLVIILLSAFFSGLVYILIRKIGSRDHPLVIVNYFMGVSTLVGGVLSLTNWVSPLSSDWLLLFSLGIYGFLGQYYMTKAFQIEDTSTVAPLKYLEVIFSIIIGVIWFGDTYTLISLFAILLIMAGLILNIKFRATEKSN